MRKERMPVLQLPQQRLLLKITAILIKDVVKHGRNGMKWKKPFILSGTKMFCKPQTRQHLKTLCKCKARAPAGL